MPTAKLKQYTVHFDNSKEFHILKREIFGSHCYYLEFDTPQPVIIDAGAHIGLTTLYFKDLYPQARIIAIEPNPRSFQLLEQNIWENNLDDIITHQVALSDSVGDITLYQDATADKWYSTTSIHSGAWNNSQETQQPISVPALPLSHFLTQPIDLLKLDIEGAEFPVLTAAADHLHHVKHLLIEFHSVNKSSWEDLADFLETNGFTITASKHGQTLKPDRRAKGLVLLEGTRR